MKPQICFFLLALVFTTVMHPQSGVHKGNYELKTQQDFLDLGLSDVRILHGDLYIYDIQEFDHLDFNIALDSIFGSIHIVENPKLQSIKGFDKVSYVQKGIYINSNPKLQNISGFDGIKSIAELRINRNTQLQSINGFNQWNSYGGRSFATILISNNPELKQMMGFNNLNQIRNLSLLQNEYLDTIDGFNQLVDVETMTITNSGLRNLAAFDGIEKCHTIKLTANAELVSIIGLDGIDIIPTLVVDSNHALRNLKGLEGFRFSRSSISIINNNSLTDLSGLNGLISVRGLSIKGNRALEVIDGFDHLKVVDYIAIENNENLTEISGFPVLKKTEGSLNIFGNSSLTQITGFNELEISEAIRLKNNALRSISDGFRSIRTTNLFEVNQNGYSGKSLVGGIGDSPIAWVDRFGDFTVHLKLAVSVPTKFYLILRNKDTKKLIDGKPLVVKSGALTNSFEFRGHEKENLELHIKYLPNRETDWVEVFFDVPNIPLKYYDGRNGHIFE